MASWDAIHWEPYLEARGKQSETEFESVKNMEYYDGWHVVVQQDWLSERFLWLYAVWAQGSPWVVPTIFDAILWYSYEWNILYDKIFLLPSSYDAGFIVGKVGATVEIWNSFLTQATTVTGIEPVDLDNCSLIFAPIPFLMPPNTDITDGKLTILPTGIMELDGHFVIYYDKPAAFTKFYVRGTRTVLIPLWHNWATEFRITYKLETIIAKTQRLREQRKLMLLKPRRTITMQTTLADTPRFRNIIMSSANRTFAVPIASEPMSLNMVGSILGMTSLTFYEQVTKLWNLMNYSTHIILRNLYTNEYDIYEIQSITDHVIELARYITYDWQANNIEAYPMMTAYMDGVDLNELTDDVIDINLVAEEYVDGSQ